MNKTILITGSTDGIGKLAALKLAKEGHVVYLHGRYPAKLAALIKELTEQSQNDQIKGFVADFSDLDAVGEMAQQILAEVSELDVLINNAGIFKSPVAQNAAGQDIRYVVNYLAPYVLTKALLPLIRKSTNPRIINLSSAAQAPVAYDILSGKAQGSERATYAQSKLALTMWSMLLAHSQPDVCVIPVNPGSLLNTRMVQEAFGTHWAPADKGADILYELALSEEYQDKSGQYFDNDLGSFGQAHADAYDSEQINRLIEATESLFAT